MSKNDFNAAFADLTARQLPAPVLDANQLVLELLRRDQWRVRILAAISIFFWFLGTSGMLVLIYGLNELVIFIRIADWNVASSIHSTTGPFSNWDMQMVRGTYLIHHSLPYIAGSVVALMLASLSTVLLVFTSRQTTLNQINYNLMQMSEQLKQMQLAGNAGTANQNIKSTE